MTGQDNSFNDQLRQTRITVSIAAEYQFKKNSGDCTIVDFSEGGLGIEANQIFVEGDLVRVKANPSKDLSLDIWCKVCNIMGRKIGLAFEEISNEQRERLQSYVYNLLESHQQGRYEAF